MKLSAMRSLRTASKVIVLLIVALAGSGLWNVMRSRQQYRRYPQIGHSVDIGNRTLNLFCSGAGGPSVIFETVSHQSGLAWSAAQSEVAKITRACWYDRAGYGWSDTGPAPRTFKAAAQDLHDLLVKAEIRGPYVLVGQQDAASEIRIYNGLYRSEVAGVVFVDGNNLDVYAHHIQTPDFIRGPWQQTLGALAPYGLASMCLVSPVLQRLTFFMPKFGPPRPTPSYGLPKELKSELDFLSDRAFGDACYVTQNEAEVIAAGDLREIPLVVLASAEQARGGGNTKAVQDWNAWWVRQEEPSLAALSSKGHVRVVERRVDLQAIVSGVADVIHEIQGNF